jgi:hypothetical protein
VRAVVDDLAARTATAAAGPPSVPDLGPAVLADQLAVLVWDACAAGCADGIPERLAGLRRLLGAAGTRP